MIWLCFALFPCHNQTLSPTAFSICLGLSVWKAFPPNPTEDLSGRICRKVLSNVWSAWPSKSDRTSRRDWVLWNKIIWMYYFRPIFEKGLIYKAGEKLFTSSPDFLGDDLLGTVSLDHFRWYQVRALPTSWCWRPWLSTMSELNLRGFQETPIFPWFAGLNAAYKWMRQKPVWRRLFHLFQFLSSVLRFGESLAGVFHQPSKTNLPSVI